MFAVNRRFPWFRKVVLALFMVPLMFAGGAFLGGLAQSQTVGEVDSVDIPRSEFLGRYQNAVEEYRRNSGNEEVPEGVLQGILGRVQSELLSHYLMEATIKRKGIYAPNSAVEQEIRQVEDFQDEEGNFSPELYREFVSDPRYYQERIRGLVGRDAVIRAVQHLGGEDIRDQIAAFRRQQRVFDETSVALSELTTVTLNIPRDDINLYYQRNSSQYRLREEADFEYFIFSLDEFAADATVSSVAVREAYEDYVADHEESARRQVSHIYIDDAEQAQQVAADAIADADNFAALAEQHSEDFASAALGGDLGIVADGDLPPALNAVLFTMSVGQVHGPVEVEEGGFSILKLDAVVAEALPAFEAVQDEMLNRARGEATRDVFEETVENLRDLAPIEFGSLVSLAAVANSALTVAATVHREAAQNAYPFNDAGVLLDVFDPLVVGENENSAPIPLADDRYLFVRAARYQPQGLQPLAEVEESITDILRASYVADDLYSQLEGQTDPATDPATELANAINDGSFNDGSFSGGAITVSDLLATVAWDKTHTLALAADGGDEAALNRVEEEEEENPAPRIAEIDNAEVDDLTADRVFSADLSRGLPAYVFLPQEEGIKIFRIREIHENAPTAEDYEVVDFFINDMTERLTGVGYLGELRNNYQYQFYNLPEITAVTQQQ